MSQLNNLEFDSESEDEGVPMLGGKVGGGLEGGYEKENGGNDNEEGKEGEIELKKKARKKARPFNEDVLSSRDGLLRIYEEFPMSCKFRGRGKEAEDLQRLLGMYKEWAFQLYPNLAMPDILARCDSLGGKGKVRSHMEQLRDRERCRYLNEVLKVPISEIRSKVLGGVDRRSPTARDMTSPEAASPSFDDLIELHGGDMLESPIHHNIANLGTDLFSASKKIFDDVIDDDDEEALIAMAEEAERLAALAPKGPLTSPTAVFANPNEDLILDLDEEEQLVILEDEEEEEKSDKDKNMEEVEVEEEEEQETVSQRQDDGGAMAVDEDPPTEI